jgi:hypothetical protein
MKDIKVLAALITGVKQMRTSMGLLPVFLVAMAALILGVAALESCKDGKAQGIQIPFEDAKIIFEVNSTDGDAGIQVFLDGEPWNEVMIFSPNEQQIFEVLGKGNLEGFGLTELFSESNEPPFEEMPLEDVLALFPEGNYQFKGTTVEGDELVGTATLTHDIPCGPEIICLKREECWILTCPSSSSGKPLLISWTRLQVSATIHQKL